MIHGPEDEPLFRLWTHCAAALAFSLSPSPSSFPPTPVPSLFQWETPVKCHVYSHLGLGNWDTGARAARTTASAPSCLGPFKGRWGDGEEVEMGVEWREGWVGREGWEGDRVLRRDGSRVEIEGGIGEGVCQEKKGSRTVSGSD